MSAQGSQALTGKDERPNLHASDPHERVLGWQPRPRPLLRTASSLVVLELSPKNCDDKDKINQNGKNRQPNAQLRVSVRWAVLLSAAVLLVGALGTGLYFCYGDGIHLGSLSSSDKTDAVKKDLLDKLNAISGSLVAAVLIPLEFVVVMSMPVVCFCFATGWMLRRGVSDLLSSLMTKIVAGVVMYLLSNGLSALNVQLVSGDYHVKITAQDLAVSSSVPDDQAVAADGPLITTWDSSSTEKSANNSVLNTILRTKLVPFEDMQPTRNKSSSQLAMWHVRPPTLSFGFESRSWQLETLQTALAPERTIEFTLDETSLPSDDKLPMSTANATYLAVAATQVLQDLLRPLWGDSLPFGYEMFNASIPQVLDQDGYTIPVNFDMKSVADLFNISANDFIGTSTPVLCSMLRESPNISVDDVRIGYKHFAISESVVMDALTLLIPTKPVGENDLESSCTADGCLAGRYLFGEKSIFIQPGVYAAAVCLNKDGTEDLRVDPTLVVDVESDTCPNRSNTSMLLVGVGKQVVGPTWNYSMDNYGLDTRNLTMTYSVTVARISWLIENLTAVFSADCDNDEGCNGIRTLLNRSSSDVLTVGEAALPLKQLPYFSVTRYADLIQEGIMWKKLVSLSPSLDFFFDESFTEGDLLLPRRFDVIVEGGDELSRIDPTNCDANTDKYIKVVEKNHMYAEESLQMTYTAGFFFLFQSGVQHSPVKDTPSLLEFSGNTQELKIQASIPTVNIYVSICGCVVVLLMSIGVALVQKKSTKTLEQGANAELVAEALLSTAKYPRLFLDMALEDLATPSSGAPSSWTPLGDLCIQLAEFTRKQTQMQTEGNATDITVVPSPA